MWMQVHIFLVLRAPNLVAALQVGPHKVRVEGDNHLPHPAGHASFDVAWDTAGLPRPATKTGSSWDIAENHHIAETKTFNSASDTTMQCLHKPM